MVHNGSSVNYTYGLDRLYEGSEEYLHDSFGNVIEHSSETYEYYPYGDLISGTIDDVHEYGYKGEVHDTDTLQYLRARYYHTSLMQFISEDSYTCEDTNPLSQNRYTFVQNNPFKYSDPSGHSAMFEEKDGSVVKTPPIPKPRYTPKPKPKPEPAYEPGIDTMNEYIHQQKNEDPNYGQKDPYEEFEEEAGLVSLNEYIHKYKNEHVKHGNPSSSNSNDEDSSEKKDDELLYVSNDLMSSFTNPGNRHVIDSSQKLSPDASFNNFSRAAFVGFAGIAAGLIAGLGVAAVLAAGLGITAGTFIGALTITGLSNSAARVSENIFGELYDFHTAGNDVDQFLINEGKDSWDDYEQDQLSSIKYDAATGLRDGMVFAGVFYALSKIFTGTSGSKSNLADASSENSFLESASKEIMDNSNNTYSWMDDLEANTWQDFSHQTSGRYGSDMKQRVADWDIYKVRKGITPSITNANSTILRNNMENAGVVIPEYENAAHHIVAGGASRAKQAQEILQKYGVDINDASNGVFLPTVKDVTNAVYHPSMHTDNYYREVTDLLSGAQSRDDVLDILGDIAEQLLDGTFIN